MGANLKPTWPPARQQSKLMTQKFETSDPVDSAVLPPPPGKSSNIRHGNFFPFRFSETTSLEQMSRRAGLEPQGIELLTRTFGRMAENFQFISLEARRLR